jgi:hypothetical protein
MVLPLDAVALPRNAVGLASGLVGLPPHLLRPASGEAGRCDD